MAKAKVKKRINSNEKGSRFEAKIARDMRRIFDPPELVAATDVAKGREHSALLKRSKVRRGRQREGAVEPDVVVSGAGLWLELQHANAANYNPIAKLAQAERDIAQCNITDLAIAICRKTGYRTTTATMRYETLLTLTRASMLEGVSEAARQIVQIDYQDLLKLITARNQRKQQ